MPRRPVLVRFLVLALLAGLAASLVLRPVGSPLRSPAGHRVSISAALLDEDREAAAESPAPLPIAAPGPTCRQRPRLSGGHRLLPPRFRLGVAKISLPPPVRPSVVGAGRPRDAGTTRTDQGRMIA